MIFMKVFLGGKRIRSSLFSVVKAVALKVSSYQSWVESKNSFKARSVLVNLGYLIELFSFVVE